MKGELVNKSKVIRVCIPLSIDVQKELEVRQFLDERRKRGITMKDTIMEAVLLLKASEKGDSSESIDASLEDINKNLERLFYLNRATLDLLQIKKD